MGRTSFFDSLKNREFRSETPSSMDTELYFLKCDIGRYIQYMSVPTDFLRIFAKADAYVLCYDLSSTDSLIFALQWYRSKSLKNKVILLGLKSDEIKNPQLEKNYIDKQIKEIFPDFHYNDHFVFSNKRREGLEKIKQAIHNFFIRSAFF